MSTRATLPISGLAATLLAVLVAAGVATSPAAAHPPEPVPPTDGALSWGDNGAGQLGDGSTAERDVPGPVSLPDDAALTQLDAGVSHTLGLTLDGRVLAWGDNGAGQLGDGSTDPSTTPVEVALPEDVTVTQVAAGSDHGLALTSDGRVLAWGSNAVGQLGDGTTTTDRTTPVEVQLPEGVTVIRLSAGEGHSLALTDDGRVLAWGGNVDGQLGDGTQLTRSTPVEVELPAGAEITGISAGRNHSLAVTSDGGVLAWGWNSDGQLGDGTTTTRTTPVEVPLPDGVTVADVSGGNRHSLAVTTTGRVLTWGYNGQGQLGGRHGHGAADTRGGATATGGRGHAGDHARRPRPRADRR